MRADTPKNDARTSHISVDSLAASVRHFSSRWWRFIRELSGEAAYERYCTGRCAAGQPLPSPGEFYRQWLEEKYSRPTRCC